MAKRVYKRNKNGEFSSTGGGKAAKKSRTKRRGSGTRKRTAGERAIAKRIAVGNRKSGGGARKGANVTQKAIRAERNQAALDRLRKQGVSIPKGSIKKVAQMKKGESVTLANGVVITRSKTGAYSAKKPKPKAKGSMVKRTKKRSK